MTACNNLVSESHAQKEDFACLAHFFTPPDRKQMALNGRMGFAGTGVLARGQKTDYER